MGCAVSGDLVSPGWRPDTKGAAPFAHPHAAFCLALAGHLLQVVGTDARRIAAGELDEAIEELDLSGDGFVFLVSPASGRGNGPLPPATWPLRADHPRVVPTGRAAASCSSGVPPAASGTASDLKRPTRTQRGSAGATNLEGGDERQPGFLDHGGAGLWAGSPASAAATSAARGRP